jgi:hypothetical protein
MGTNMTVLHVGVNDIPYSVGLANAKQQQTNQRQSKSSKPRKPPKRLPGEITTYDVAKILEAKYGLFSMFTVIRGKDIQDAVEDGLRGAISDLLAGIPPSRSDPFGDVGSKVEAAFKEALDRQEFNSRIPGVPTKAALMGRNLAFKRKRGPPRPSFEDSMTLYHNLRAWVS